MRGRRTPRRSWTSDTGRSVESRFGIVFDESPLAILITLVRTGMTVDANARFCELLGLTRDRLIGADIRELGVFDLELRERISHDLAEGRPVRGAETWIKTFAGERRWIQYSTNLIEFEGEPAMFSMILDVTERRRAERRVDIQLSIAALLSTARSLEDIAGSLLGQLCSAGRWSHAKLRLVDPASDQQRVVAEWGNAQPMRPTTLAFPISQGGATFGSIELSTESSEPIDAQLDAQLDAVYASIGLQIGQFIVRARAARELERSQSRLSSVIEVMTEGVIIGLPDGQLLHWNPAALELHGFASSHEWEHSLATFTAIMELSTLDGAVVPFERWPMARIVAGEKLHNLELQLRRLDIAWTRVFSYGGTLVEQADGSKLVVLTLADVTERTRSAAALQRLNESLEQRVDERTSSLSAANAELEAFTYSVSHDLRAPLRAIRGFADILMQDYGATLPEPARAHLATIQARGNRMSALLADLLELSKAVRRPMTRRSVDMRELATDTLVEVLATAGPGAHPAVEVLELPPAIVDASLVKQVWWNLISNAVKFSRGKPGARITVGCVLASPPVYFVRDTGVGFAADDADRLFVPFQRLHDEALFEGTGVGLALVQRIVARHGGRVWAESIVGEGATFYFTLTAGARSGAVTAGAPESTALATAGDRAEG